jgi:predicted ribosomally synthesized peptide with nif11-like leader
MTSDAVTAFVDRVMSDTDFRDQLAAAPTPEDRLRIANAAGFAIDADDVGTLRSALGVQEISDADLETVAGGMSDRDATIASTVIISAMGTSAVAVAGIV